jgi:UDP-glucose 4-epimerase
VFGNGSQTRDFTYVDDIVRANMLAMRYPGEESVFNIGGGSRISLNAALDVLNEAGKYHFEVIYKDVSKGDVTHTYADIQLAKSEMGFEPTMKFEQGLANEVEWVDNMLAKLDDRQVE